MKNQVLVAAAAAAVIVTAPAVTAPVAAESVKVGYMQGFAGGRGIFGRYGFEGFELALDHLGGDWREHVHRVPDRRSGESDNGVDSHLGGGSGGVGASWYSLELETRW